MPRLPVLFILATVVIESMGIGLILPVMPSLLREVQGVGLSEAAVWGGVLSSSYALMQFLFSPAIGNLSDRFGRRPVLLLSMAVIFLDYILMALAHTIWLLLIGRIIAGIAAATMSTAMAFMADISKPEEKAANFGLISAGFGLGFVLGPAMGGLLAELGPRAPFWAAAMLSGANLLFGLAVLPETLRRQRPFDIRRANPLGGLRAVTKLPGLGALLTLWFFYQVANWVYPAVWAYFTQAAFGWEERMVGISLAVYGISMVVVQGGLIRVVIPRLGERRVLAWFVPYNCVLLFCVAFVQHGWIMLALTPLSALGALVQPAIQGLASRVADDDAQGELQGVLASITAIAAIVSPLLMTRIFNLATEGTRDFPGAPFLAAAALMCVAWGLLPRKASRAQA
ncbi:TCR/Tet family MFS transporter [Jannaschia sp. S6380]|uniref:TCR/Tet family MFS transporter n=1 Tax=Jannaschia sp. S6380 TaxID=2926408 RepID=UPI001FF2D004|nr:TCR/Tet family MFS transporter [Jannaschia sp. S6380]MCK0167824.1 TCR/Tet family MFS transporter [Jannaschia sp. S6380]